MSATRPTPLRILFFADASSVHTRRWVASAVERGAQAVVIGDSRDIDRPLLQRHPELHALYAHWAGKDSLRRVLQGHAE